MTCEIKRPAGAPVTFAGTVETVPLSPIASGKVTIVTLNNTAWTPLPATAKVDRQGLAIQNLSGDAVLLNWSNTAPASEYIFLASGAERFYQVLDSATLYARLQNNASGVVHVEETGL